MLRRRSGHTARRSIISSGVHPEFIRSSIRNAFATRALVTAIQPGTNHLAQQALKQKHINGSTVVKIAALFADSDQTIGVGERCQSV